ncbi:AMIN-like domain-containing (lipo)protein [Rhodococcus cerastii]
MARSTRSRPTRTTPRSRVRDLSGTSTDSDDTFSPYAGPERVRGDAESTIVSADFLADPGGISHAFIGVAADRPAFTVTTTEEPAAVVVTVEN